MASQTLKSQTLLIFKMPFSDRIPIFSIESPQQSRLPMLGLPDTIRNNIIAVVGEFVGTFLFLFWAFVGAHIASTPVAPPGADPRLNVLVLLYISVSFAVSLTANVWIFYRITGGLFNPGVALALWLVGGLPTVRCLLVIVAELVAGIAAAGIASALCPGVLNVNTTLGGGTSIAQGVFIEMFLTAQLVLSIIMLAVVKHKGTFLAPLGIGLSFFVTQLCGIYFTGAGLNLARSLGPAVISHSFPGYFWIYVVGPGLGALLASGFYALMTMLHWQTCNPGQDADGLEAPPVILKEDPVDSKNLHQRAASETTAVSYGQVQVGDNNGTSSTQIV